MLEPPLVPDLGRGPGHDHGVPGRLQCGAPAQRTRLPHAVRVRPVPPGGYGAAESGILTGPKLGSKSIPAPFVGCCLPAEEAISAEATSTVKAVTSVAASLMNLTSLRLGSPGTSEP